MDREEILARSRRENVDEGDIYMANKGRRYGVQAMFVMFMLLILFNFWQGQNNYSLFAVLWVYLGCEAYGTYRMKRERARLVTAVCSGLAGLLFAVIYVVGVLR